MTKTRAPRTIKGFQTRITEVLELITEAQEELNGLTDLDDGYADKVAELTQLEVELASLESGLDKLASATDNEDEPSEDNTPEDKPQETKKSSSRLGQAGLVRCASETNYMVNPFNPSVKFVGHSVTETVIDKWVQAQIDAGILVLRG